MWISKTVQGLLDNASSALRVQSERLEAAKAENTRLTIENARLRSDMDWFKHRLNQVERERGQLIQAAIGVKVAVPEFVPTYEDPGKALNEMPDLTTIGGDAPDGESEHTPDYSMLPGYGKR